MSESESVLLTALGARVHLFLRPEYKNRFTTLFKDILGCSVSTHDFGMPHPIVLVSFPDGSAFSVEFSDLAVAEPPTVTDETAVRGAWIEFRTADVEGTQSRLRNASVPEFTHPGSRHVYFSAPGGQVFRVIDVNYAGP